VLTSMSVWAIGLGGATLFCAHTPQAVLQPGMTAATRRAAAVLFLRLQTSIHRSKIGGVYRSWSDNHATTAC